MRTTVEFDAGTAAAVEQLRRDDGVGVSQAVNELIRRGMLPRREVRPFQQRTRKLGLKIDVSNVANALEDLDGPEAREVLVDANILAYSVDEDSPFHSAPEPSPPALG